MKSALHGIAVNVPIRQGRCFMCACVCGAEEFAVDVEYRDWQAFVGYHAESLTHSDRIRVSGVHPHGVSFSMFLRHLTATKLHSGGSTSDGGAIAAGRGRAVKTAI